MSQKTVTKNGEPSDTTAENTKHQEKRSTSYPGFPTDHEFPQKRIKIDGEPLHLENRGVIIIKVPLEPDANDDDSRFMKSYIEKRAKLPQDNKIRTLDLYGSKPILMWIPIKVEKKTGSSSNEFFPN